VIAAFLPSQLRWQDLFDIALVFIVTYRLLLLIRGTRALQVLSGLLVLLAAFFISERLRLYVFNYVLKQVFEYLFIIVVVLFQDEIRRALANIGRGPIAFSSGRSSKLLQSIDEVCKAAHILAVNRIGALLVLERQHGLKNYTDAGVKIDARVSAEILVSIFQTDSPIHDGAVIVKEDRVLAAGCFVPVSLEGNVERNLGTRHRAALGLSRESDAVVVVVSEERGEIGLALEGYLSQNLSPVVLKEQILMAFDLIERRENTGSFYARLMESRFLRKKINRRDPKEKNKS
jgi:diadenylate cyclase